MYSEAMRDITTYSLRLPNSLKQALREAAQEGGSSINQFIVMAVAEKLAAMKTASIFEKARQEANLDKFLQMLNRKGGEPPREGDEI
jgi:predicted HicB family RNase H-like nuclease